MNLVVGSINLDFTIYVPRFPEVGETVTDGDLFISPGGKGFNQAVASSRAGVKTKFVGAVGDDIMWEVIKKFVSDEKMLETEIFILGEEQTGSAFIVVDRLGNNRIVVSPGANKKIPIDDLMLTLEMTKFSQILLQCEVDYEVISRVIDFAKKRGCKIFLNTAPFKSWVEDVYMSADFLIMNEIEAKLLCKSSEPSADSEEMILIAREIQKRTGKYVIITMGENGVVVKGPDIDSHFPAFEVTPVDTTGAGDTFCGYFSAEMLARGDIVEAIRISSVAAALCVTKKGAVSSIPTKTEVEKFLSLFSRSD